MAAPIGKLVVSICCQRTHLLGWHCLRYASRTSTQNLTSFLEDPSASGSNVVISGWVKSIREHKDHVFLHITDGSGAQPLQVVTTPSCLSRTNGVTFGSCVRVDGQLVPSPAKGQAVEVVAESISVLGACDNTFPFGARHAHTADYCRDFLHLRPRTESFASLLRLRSAAAALFHAYFQKNGYICVHTPVITSNDCEGGVVESCIGFILLILGDHLFQPAKNSADSDTEAGSQTESEGKRKPFFNNPAYLTVSGQLHLEAVASAIAKVYSFGPTFRAENSRGRHHLSEFYMIEAEVAFITELEDLLQIMEEMVKETCLRILEEHQKEMNFYLKRQGSKQHMDLVERAVSKPFAKITYSEAAALLQKRNDKFQFKVEWGSDLKKEHEKFLTKAPGQSSLKPFYAKVNLDGNTVAAVDLLVPGVGELIGGSLREDNLDLLSSRLQHLGILDEYKWYTDLRQNCQL
ncbi:hypothetical protein BaRGS_00031812 [Batillaria attramentaria]|uniref:asparagine--tRNA ligase n=1 Tax=Batillaria attramentaria TaxID=370345 RepID=A0ABD0JQS2_9CAEN